MAKRKILLMYHGERVNFIGKIYQLFKDKDGKEYTFSGIKHVWFGEVFPMLDKRMKIKPERVEEPGWEPTEKERLEYEAQKLVVRAHRQAKLKAFKISRPHENITRAVELMRPFYRNLSNFDQRRLMDWFSNECSKKGKK